jgi:LacI family transcriptional regulator
MTTSKKQITIKHVAQEAGVSTQTVSRVINQRPDVAAETRLRVQDVIDRLGYQPSYVARSLIRGRSATLGVVAYGLDYYGPSRTLSGIEQQASELGFTLLLSLVRDPDARDNGPERLLRDMLARHVDGIIWAVPDIGQNRDWINEDIRALSTPVVFLSMEPCPGLSVIAIDNCIGGRMAVEHLLARGCRRIGHVTGPLDWWEARQRHAGWRDALEQAGVKVDEGLIAFGNWSAESGMRGLRQLLDQRPDVEAVFFGNDQMALGGIRAAHQLGLRIPGDVAIIGFDDIPESAYFCPPLSTVRQPIFELGAHAVRELNRRIEAGQLEDSSVQPRARLIEPQLVIRESSTAAEGHDIRDSGSPAAVPPKI